MTSDGQTPDELVVGPDVDASGCISLFLVFSVAYLFWPFFFGDPSTFFEDGRLSFIGIMPSWLGILVVCVLAYMVLSAVWSLRSHLSTKTIFFRLAQDGVIDSEGVLINWESIKIARFDGFLLSNSLRFELVEGVSSTLGKSWSVGHMEDEIREFFNLHAPAHLSENL